MPLAFAEWANLRCRGRERYESRFHCNTFSCHRVTRAGQITEKLILDQDQGVSILSKIRSGPDQLSDLLKFTYRDQDQITNATAEVGEHPGGMAHFKEREGHLFRGNELIRNF